jgi:hypothetical protein
MYAQASGRLKADAVCTILKALLAIRPDGWLHGSTICPRGKDVRIWISKQLFRRRQENIQPVLVGQGDQ